MFNAVGFIVMPIRRPDGGILAIDGMAACRHMKHPAPSIRIPGAGEIETPYEEAGNARNVKSA